MTQQILCAIRVVKEPNRLQAHSEDSDQTGRIPRLIWVLAGRKSLAFVLMFSGSNTIFDIHVFLNIYIWHSLVCKATITSATFRLSYEFGKPNEHVHRQKPLRHDFRGTLVIVGFMVGNFDLRRRVSGASNAGCDHKTDDLPPQVTIYNTVIPTLMHIFTSHI